MLQDDDAQFMLLASFIIGIGLVITTIMLNNVIYQSNMASESGIEPDKYEVINLMQISMDEVRSAYRNSTEIGGTKTQMYNNFSNEMTNFNNNLSKLYAFHGAVINVSWENWTNKNFANFTDNGNVNGNSDWVVVYNVNASNITVNPTGSFKINLTNTTKSWEYTVSSYNNTNNSVILSQISPPYDIQFKNGSNAYGDYNITGTTANGKSFIRIRSLVMNVTLKYSSSKMRANITIPVSVW